MPWETKESFARDWTKCHTGDQDVNDPNMVPCEPGQLTVEGEKMCRELGKRFRAEYGSLVTSDFLESFSTGKVDPYTTDVGRTKLSLKRVLEGMFPGSTIPDSLIESRAVLTTGTGVDTDCCSNLVRKHHEASQEVTASLATHAGVEQLAQALEKAFGADPRPYWVGIGDWAHTRTFHGLPLRDDVPTKYLPLIEHAAWRRFNHLMGGHFDIVHFRAGRLVHELVSNATAAAKGSKSEPTLRIYSGHDTTLCPLAGALGIPLVSWPPFSSHIVLELWRERPEAHGDQFPRLTAAQEVEQSKEMMLITDPRSKHPDVILESPVDGTKLPHIRSDQPSNKVFHDPHIVRILFNGTLVKAMPLSVLEESVKFFRIPDNESFQQLCGEYDPNLKKPAW